MNLLEVQHHIGCKVMSHDPGYKLIARFSTPHGPYTIVKITKSGLVQLDGYGQSVAPRFLVKCPKPDKAGIWEWFDELGRKKLVDVVNVEFDSQRAPTLRVAWWGGYYDVHDSVEDIYNGNGKLILELFEKKAEWPDRWGSFIGERGIVKDTELYFLPCPELMEKIIKENETRNTI